MRLLFVIAVILVLTVVLFGAGALDDVANVIIQILIPIKSIDVPMTRRLPPTRRN